MSLEFTVPRTNPQSPTYVAVDTNVLLDRAEGQEDILDCLATVSERVENYCFAVLPTVIQELEDLSELSGATIGGPDWKKKRDLAGAALDKILDWGFQPINSFRFATELWSRQQERFVSAGSYRWIKSPTR